MKSPKPNQTLCEVFAEERNQMKIKTYDAGKLGRVTIPEPDETDNPEWVRADIALAIQAQRDELLAAAIRLVEMHDEQMLTSAEWDAMKAAIKKVGTANE
jgi:hypothetical protein